MATDKPCGDRPRDEPRDDRPRGSGTLAEMPTGRLSVPPPLPIVLADGEIASAAHARRPPARLQPLHSFALALGSERLADAGTYSVCPSLELASRKNMAVFTNELQKYDERASSAVGGEPIPCWETAGGDARAKS